MQPNHRVSVGRQGEDVACAELRRRGYAILDRRYRSRYGEIDIVARDGPTYVFIEVKSRLSAAFGTPAEAVTAQKQRRVALMAVDFLTRHALYDRPCRFDVVAVTFDRGQPHVEIFVNAYDAA